MKIPMRLAAGVLTLSMACAFAALEPGLTVRVQTTNGVPRLLVNGEAVRPRMFFGGPGPGLLRAEPAGSRVEFDFVAEQDARSGPAGNRKGTGTLHFRFGQVPGEVFLDDIRVVDVASGRQVSGLSDFEGGMESFSRNWTWWPPGPANTVATVGVETNTGAGGSAGLRVSLRAPGSGGWPDWHIYHLPNLPIERGRRYRVGFWIRADPVRDLTVALYRPGEPFVFLGGPPGAFEAQIRLAHAAGVDFVTFPIEMPWPEPGKTVDWLAVDAVCAKVLSANPQALLLPRFGAEPPEWWRRANPDHVMTWEDGSRQVHAVVASPLYREQAAARVRALVTHLEAKFGNHMAGYHPCGQNTGEWFYQGTWENLLNGYALADRAAWREWLKGKYKTDDALRAAWKSPLAALARAEVPSAEARRASPFGVLRNPATERPVVDFAEFQQDAMADLVCELARATREASGRRKLVVFFYGYVFEFGPIRLGPSTCGHYALRRVLGSPDIDVLCSPISYFDRGLGGSGPSMTAAESVALAGKLWLAEDDTRTYLGSGEFPGKVDGAKDFPETRTLLLRNLAHEATRHFATWWMDLGMTGWFNDERLWADMRQFEKVDQLFLDDTAPFRPEVAAVIDERSMCLASAGAWHLTEPGIYQVRRALGRLGAPYGQFLQDDVVNGLVRARLWVFLNSWQVSGTERDRLLARTAGGCRVWCYAPGVFDESGPSPENMRSLTGFRLEPIRTKPRAVPTERGRALGLRTGFGADNPVEPLYAATDVTTEETMATYADGSAAVALRKREDGWSMFVGVPGLSSELLRIAARKAGAHLFTESDCNVYANGPVVALHASGDGAVVLDTGRNGTVRDALSGQPVASGRRLTLQMKKGETRVLRVRP